MTVELEVPNQEGLSCELCGTRSEKSLVHKLKMQGTNKNLLIDLCDICVADLKDAVEGY